MSTEVDREEYVQQVPGRGAVAEAAERVAAVGRARRAAPARGRAATEGPGGREGTIIVAGTGGQAPVEPPPFVCSPAQWVCSASYSACAGEGYRLPTDRGCDETGPKEAEDCADGESLVCGWATAASEGVPFTKPVPFACRCRTDQSSCEAMCDELYYDGGTCHDAMEGSAPRSVLCGCAVIVLR